MINNDSVDGHDDELLRDHIIRAEAGSPSAQATRPEIPYLSAQGVLAWKTARKASRDVPLPHGWLRDSYLNQRDHVRGTG